MAGSAAFSAAGCLGPALATQELFFQRLAYASIPEAEARAQCAYDYDRLIPDLDLPPDAMGRLTVRNAYAISCMRAKGYELSGVGPVVKTW